MTAPPHEEPPRHDETKGWIFTPEYHQQLDENRQLSAGTWRHGSPAWLREVGWSEGLYQFKDQSLSDIPDTEAARWPEPFEHYNLEKKLS